MEIEQDFMKVDLSGKYDLGGGKFSKSGWRFKIRKRSEFFGSTRFYLMTYSDAPHEIRPQFHFISLMTDQGNGVYRIEHAGQKYLMICTEDENGQCTRSQCYPNVVIKISIEKEK